MKREQKLVVITLVILAIALIAVGGIWTHRIYKEGRLWNTTVGLSDEMNKLKDCPIHKIPLDVEKVKAIGGVQFEYLHGFLQARSKEFPYANTESAMTNDPKVGWVIVTYCSDCRLAQKKWNASENEK